MYENSIVEIKITISCWAGYFDSIGLSAIPTYSMSIFLYLKDLSAKLNSMLSQFWWDENIDLDGSVGSIPVFWNVLMVWALRIFETFNLACLAK